MVGTSGMIFGLGFTGQSSASAVSAPFNCTAQNTAVASTTPSDNVTRINDILDTFEIGEVGEICLNGNFVLNDRIVFYRDIHLYGVGSSSIERQGGGIFHTEVEVRNAITIENLTVKNTTIEPAVSGGDVVIKESTFSSNSGGAVYATGDVTVTNSVFTGNSGTHGAAILAVNEDSFIPMDVSITGSTFSGNEAQSDGGAVLGYGSVQISSSTFFDNTANLGGAVYALPALGSGDINVTNSTFRNNVATGDGAEGGALFAVSGQVIFSTFLDNEAPPPVDGQDVPGSAIYKAGSSQFNVGGNIFAGSSPYPQLGYGLDVSPFIDLGGNVFSTSSATETDITQDDSSVFGASLISIFGTNTPTLATFSPNSSGTQTIGLVAGSPALNSVPNDVPFTSVTFDQRGATRSHPADAGAFEFIATPAATTPAATTPAATTPAATTPAAPAALAKTGNESPFWISIVSAALVSLGGLALGLRSRLRRRIIQ